MSTGAESLPRRPSPLKVPFVRTSAARGRIKYSTDSDGAAAPGRRALATYESAWRADVTQDLRALTTYPGSPWARLELRHRRPELRTRARLGERQRRQVLAGGDVAQDRVAAVERRRRRDRLRRAHVHGVDHRGRRAPARQLLDDRGEDAHALPAAAELTGANSPVRPLRASASTLSVGKRPVASTSAAWTASTSRATAAAAATYREPDASTPPMVAMVGDLHTRASAHSRKACREGSP